MTSDRTDARETGPRRQVYVLHVFQKKSASGIATPQRHLDLIKQRLREAVRIHEAKKEGRA